MADNLRLKLILDVQDKALGAIKRIAGGSSALAKSLKDARDAIKGLNKQQADIKSFRIAQVTARQQSRSLVDLREKAKGYTALLEDQRARHTNIKGSVQAARAEYNLLATSYMDGAAASQEHGRKLELARISLLSSEQAYERSLSTLRQYKTKVKNADQSVEQMSQKLAGTNQRVENFRDKLEKAGVSGKFLGSTARTLNQQLQVQAKRLEAIQARETALAKLRQRHASQMMHMGMVAGAGAAGVAAGRQAARPVLAVVDAYRQQEDAASQLRASMMGPGAKVGEDFQKINDMAVQLGDRLPGTTADFTEMMTMLRRQGMSSQVILGGLGESAAYLGVQLRMPVTEAAEFAAKMQDATGTVERDMMGLMDVIQRTYYLGVDSGNMLQGFTKMSPVLSAIKKKGLEAVNTLAPMLVMFDQAGMKGEASGNAVRKVVFGAMNAKKVAKGSAAAGMKLDFTDGKGEFGGFDKMYDQLDKLAHLSTEKRLGAMQAIFGDDAETLQVIQVLMEKGRAGYAEVVAKMAAQASLRERVNEQLKTITNLWEAATGAFTNVMASVGETVGDDVKNLSTLLGEVATKTGAWVKEHPGLIRVLTITAAIVSGLMMGVGSLMMAFAAIATPLLIAKFLFAKMGLTLFGVSIAALPLLKIIAIVGLLAAAAYLVWSNWDGIIGGLKALWEDFANGVRDKVAAIGGYAVQFGQFGMDMMKGLANGIWSGLVWVKDAIVGAAESTAGWFADKLRIKSPSRVFMALGQNIPEGAALGIQRGSSLLRGAALAMATVPLTAAAGMGGGPLMAAGAGGGGGASVGGGQYHITINGAGMDAQAIAKAVSAELDRREGGKRRAVLSQLADIDG